MVTWLILTEQRKQRRYLKALYVLMHLTFQTTHEINITFIAIL